MSASCEFDVAVRLVGSDGVTVLIDLNDHAAGYAVATRQEPGDVTNKSRVDADHVDGDYTVAESDAAGDYVVAVTVFGASWAQCEQRFQTLRAAYRSEAHYYLETVVEGVTKRWRTERPESVQPGSNDAPNLANHRQTYSIRWHVQPNPTITFV